MVPNEHRIAIVETGKGFLVRPAAVVAQVGDTLLVRNMTRLQGTFVFPHEGILSARERAGAAGVPLPPDTDVVLTVASRGEGGAFPYGVLLCEAEVRFPRRLFATGESAPHLIIE
ncbi:MAG: hypothetical protein F9K18_02665 [Thermoanaerobaculia bacterium]|nr:MAG: hypothetical protein F9K18_02665 [Thermoanaerobaculia bacterium]